MLIKRLKPNLVIVNASSTQVVPRIIGSAKMKQEKK